jgi:hypothetical protein
MSDVHKPSLADSYAKIDRAEEHIAYLERFIREFIETTPYKLTADFHSKTGQHLARIACDDTAIAVFLQRCGIIAGEVAHALRSSLNHLVYQLIRLNPGGKHTSRTEFPIFVEGQIYKAESERKIRGVPDAAKALIEFAQPYNGTGTDDPLWLVHDLDVKDKHHILVVVSSAAVQRGVNKFVGSVFVGDLWRPIWNGTVWCLSSEPIDTNTVDQPTIDVVFETLGTKDGQSVVPRLIQLAEGVRLVVDKFQPFF